MVTGDGVAEGDGPPGEFILWAMGRNQGAEFWAGVYVVRNNHATEIWQPGNKPKSGYFKGGKDDAEGPGVAGGEGWPILVSGQGKTWRERV